MKELVCIVCPNGCNLRVDEGKVSGNLCKRGEEFALEEIKDPKRSLTTTCKTIFETHPVVPVKSDGLVKKDIVKEIVNEINKVTIDKPLKIGDIVIENVLDTNVNIVMCSNELKEN